MDNEDKDQINLPEHIRKLARDLFSQYPPTASLCGEGDRLLMAHILKIRAKAYAIHDYPCIALCTFLDPSINKLWNYESEIVPRVKAPSSAKLLDVGCCFGQTIRRLVMDGADQNNLIGVDLHNEFLQLGYELFKDGPESSHPLGSRFEAGTIFDKDFLADLNGSIEIIHASLMLHLFPLEGQLQVAKRFDELLTNQPGALIVGGQLGIPNAGEISPGGVHRHNAETFKEFWRSVGSGNWEVEITEKKVDLDQYKVPLQLAHTGEDILMLRFVVKRM